MVTRRNALFATAALTLGPGRRTEARPNLTAQQTASGAIGHNQTEVQLCLELAEQARGCIREAALKSDASQPEFIGICQDVEGICLVTATVLSRESTNAAAICQACADACDRFASACRAADSNGKASQIQQLAVRCGNACRSLIEPFASPALQ